MCVLWVCLLKELFIVDLSISKITDAWLPSELEQMVCVNEKLNCHRDFGVLLSVSRE